MQQKQRSKEGRERMKISRLRHQPDSYSPFCLLVLRPTLRIQTQGRSAEKRETRSLYREGCGGGRQEMTAGSCIAHLWEGTAVGAGGGKREVPNTYFNGISPYIYLHKIIMKNIFFSLLYTPHSPSDFPVFSFLSPVCFLCMSRLCLCV